nr:hypothetical protein [Tanacetum cinerariifolium]
MLFEIKIISDKKKFSVSLIYAENEPKYRLKLWDILSEHMSVTDSHPWTILGDFNVIMYADENLKGSIDNYHGVKEFRGCMEHIDMEDLAMNGLFFTWVQKMKDLKMVFPIDEPDVLFSNKLDHVIALAMVKEIHDVEIRVAVNDIEDNKVPRPDGFTSRVMVCLNSASFSICVNGESQEFFKSKRGLRQGDPVSPYLFTLVMEVFTLMLRRQVKKEKNFKYHWGCKRGSILNLCFADDLMLFCHDDVISASVLRRALDEFCLAFGLRPNMAKSTVFFGNLNEDVKMNIKNVMLFSEGTLPVRLVNYELLMQHKMDLKVKVAELIYSGIWKWPRGWDERYSKTSYIQAHGLKTVTHEVINAAKVWNIPIDRMHMNKYILDDLIPGSMDLNDDNG